MMVNVSVNEVTTLGLVVVSTVFVGSVVVVSKAKRLLLLKMKIVLRFNFNSRLFMDFSG